MDESKYLLAVIKETANASFSISANDDGWNCYFITQKKKFEDKDLQGLCKIVTSYLLDTRIQREVESSSKRKGALKPYKLP